MSPLTQRALEGTTLDRDVEAWLASEPCMVVGRNALYQRLREHGPLYVHDAMIIVPGYEEAKDVLLDTDRFHSGLGDSDRGPRSDIARARELLPAEDRVMFDELVSWESAIFGKMNGEQHWRLRTTVHSAFTPRRIAEFEESIEGYLLELLASVAAEDVTEFMTIAYRLPLLMIVDLLGFPRSDMEQIHDWAARFLARYERRDDSAILRSAHGAVLEFCAYVEENLAELRKGSRPNPLLEALTVGGGELGMDPIGIALNCATLLIAGHETTMTVASSGLVELLRTRDTWTELTRDAELIPGAVEELLRLVAPAQWIGRVAQECATIAGYEVPIGTSVAVVLASANRDPSVFPGPDRVDLRRSNGRDHLSFAIGPHFCLGASLARLEGLVIFRTLARRFPDLELAIDVTELDWVGSSMLPSIRSLPVALGRDRGA